MTDDTNQTASPTEPRHAVQVVARRTGLSPDALRVWERRHGAVKPGRSAGRQRLYSDADIHRLHVLRRLTLAGHRIGHVAQLPIEELEVLLKDDVREEPSAPGAQSHVGDIMQATEALDMREIRRRLDRASVELGADVFVDGVVMPLLRQVGDKWHAGELSPAHEHALSAQLDSLMLTMLQRFDGVAKGPDLVVSTPAGQRHGLAALAVAVAAAAEGWRVSYLGVDLPAEIIVDAVKARNARAVALSFVHSTSKRETDEYLAELNEGLPEGVVLFVGGAAARDHRGTLKAMGASVVESLDDWRQQLEKLRES